MTKSLLEQHKLGYEYQESEEMHKALLKIIRDYKKKRELRKSKK